jgi:hypothetical protein
MGVPHDQSDEDCHTTHRYRYGVSEECVIAVLETGDRELYDEAIPDGLTFQSTTT